MNVYITCSAGRRGAGSIDCLVCGERIHQHQRAGLFDPTLPWFDGDGSDTGLLIHVIHDGRGPATAHQHLPAKEMGPVLGPFEYVELTYTSVRVDDGEIIAYWHAERNDWILTDLAGDAAGEAYSDLTIAQRSDAADTALPQIGVTA